MYVGMLKTGENKQESEILMNSPQYLMVSPCLCVINISCCMITVGI